MVIIAGYLAGYEKRFLNILSTLLFKQERLLRAGEEGKMMPKSALLQFYTQKLIPINEK